MKYKYTSLGFVLWILTMSTSRAQLISEGADLVIQSGATIHVDGLSLTPSISINLNNRFFYRIESSISGTPHSSITRVHRIVLPIVFTGKVGMRYKSGELFGNQEADLQFSFNNPETNIFSIPTNKSVVDANANYIEENVTNLALYDITATSSGSTLPVRLIDFTATAKETTAWLAWSTSEEINSDYFEIQHSVDGKQWNEVGRVKANEESKVAKTYAFEHDQPANGENLYRLKMVDQDNTFAYSRVRSIAIKKGNALTLHPNPVTDWLTIKTADWASIKKLGITNVSGVNVKELNERQLSELGDKKIDLHDFPSGIYMISITGNDGAVQTEKIFKN